MRLFNLFYLVIVTLTRHRKEKKNKRKEKKRKNDDEQRRKRQKLISFPLEKKNSKKTKKNSFRLGRQEDAHEYLVALLDAMHEACLSRAFPRHRPAENASTLSPPPRFLRPPPPALAATTLVHALFGGVLRSQIRCLRCGYESNTYEPCVDVSLDVVAADDEGREGGGGGGGHGPHHHFHHNHHNHHHHHLKHHLHKRLQQHFHQKFQLSSHASAPAATTLQGALSRFTAGERLEGENAYACPGCREEKEKKFGGKKKGHNVSSSSPSPPRSPAVKAITLHSTPRVLVLQLKRFEYHAAGRKISRKVDFGTELDVAPFMSAAADSARRKEKGSEPPPSSKQQRQQQQNGGPRENGTSNNSSKKRKAEGEQEEEGGGPHPPKASIGPEQTRYSLSGVLVHSGHSVHSGHYTCFVRAGTGLWHGCDDDHVSQVSERVVLAQRAYILFYVRSDGGGEGGEREKEEGGKVVVVKGERLGNGGGVSSAAAAAAASRAAAADDGPVPPPVPSLLLPNGKPLAAERQRGGVTQGKAGEGGGGSDKATSPAKR